MKYAVYVLVVEDTEANDQDLALRCESMIRLGGNLTQEQADELSRDVDATYWTNWDYAK